jgi:two-component system, chemotaxis family, response regulator Rcp1
MLDRTLGGGFRQRTRRFLRGDPATRDRKADDLGFRVLRDSGMGMTATEELTPAPQPRPVDIPMTANGMDGAVEILLVEDNPADARLTREVFEGGRLTTHLNVVADGEEALAFLRREGPYAESPRPKLVLLDLNLPRKDGREVLQELKADPSLSRIPVIVLTTSAAEADILHSYDLQANCFITKPLDLDEFFEVVRAIEDFWLTTARLPAT